MLLGHRSRSQSAFEACAFQNCVQPITLSCMVGFKNYLAEMFIMTRRCVACKNMLLGQRSRSQPVLKVCAFQSHVWPITSSFMVGLENYLAEIILTTRQCVECKNHVAETKVKVKAYTYSLCVDISCSVHNFIRHGGIWKLFDTNDHQMTRQCVLCKNSVAVSKIKFRVFTLTVYA